MKTKKIKKDSFSKQAIEAKARRLQNMLETALMMHEYYEAVSLRHG